MGATCCVAAKSKPVLDESNGVTARMSTRFSPLWNVQWDNRGRVAGEETAIRWFADMSSRESQLGNISEERTPENFQSHACSRPQLPQEGIYVSDFRSPNSDASICRSISLEGEDAANFQAASDRSPMMPSISSVSTSPLPTGDHLFHAGSTPVRLTCKIPENNLYRQATDERMKGFRSPGIDGEKPSPMRPGWTYHSARGSHDGSSDSCSIPEYLAYSHREGWSVDSLSLGLNNGDTITRSNSRHYSSPCSHIKICGACSKLLSDKSSFGSQKVMPTNELAVVAVMVCGHVYHAECLERMTLEVSKYDPACPVCTFGEPQAMKLFEKAIKAEMEFRLKHSKRSRSRIVDSEFESIRVGNVGKGVKIDSSSGMRSSFLKRHFSLGSKGNKPLPESQSSKKKAFSWARTRSSK